MTLNAPAAASVAALPFSAYSTIRVFTPMQRRVNSNRSSFIPFVQPLPKQRNTIAMFVRTMIRIGRESIRNKVILWLFSAPALIVTSMMMNGELAAIQNKESAEPATLKLFDQEVPGTAFKFQMLPIVASADG